MSGLLWISAVLAATAAALAVPPRAGAGLAERPPVGAHTGAAPARAPVGGGPPTVRLRLLATGVAGLATWLMVSGAVGAVLAAVSCAVAWHLVGRMEPPAERRRREQLLRDLPHVVDLMAAMLAVGASPTAAVERIAEVLEPPMRSELSSLTARLRLGADPVDAWGELGEHPQLGPLGRCLVRATDSGASVADAMRRLAEDLRRSARAEMETRARSVGVKATAPLGACLLPAFVLVGVVPLVAGSVSHLLTR